MRALLLPVPRLEAFALPGIVERANNAEASRRICIDTPKTNTTVLDISDINISTRHLLFATFLTIPESCEVSNRQERASSKRFQNVCRASRIAHDRASAMRSATVNLVKKIIQINSGLAIKPIKACNISKRTYY